jgi:hypothetical protein
MTTEELQQIVGHIESIKFPLDERNIGMNFGRCAGAGIRISCTSAAAPMLSARA